jgi:hypothetical protein
MTSRREAAQPSAPPPPRRDNSRRNWILLGIASPVVGVLLGLAIWSTGVLQSNGSTTSVAQGPAATTRSTPSRTTATTPKPPAKPRHRAAVGPHRVFAGQAFSVAYPAGWTVANAETPASWGTDTTIVSPTDAHTLMRIDVATHPPTLDPVNAAEPVIAGVARQPGYRPLGITAGTLDGRSTERWEFVVQEDGILLHKEDDFFFTPSGIGVAILTSAPADAYGSLAARFAALRQTLTAH